MHFHGGYNLLAEEAQKAFQVIPMEEKLRQLCYIYCRTTVKSVSSWLYENDNITCIVAHSLQRTPTRKIITRVQCGDQYSLHKPRVLQEHKWEIDFFCLGQSEEASQRWASKRRAGVDCLAGRAARVLQAEVAVPSADLNFTGPQQQPSDYMLK